MLNVMMKNLCLALFLSATCCPGFADSDHRKIMEISDLEGRTVHARILYVGERNVFLKTMKNTIHRCELATLSEPTVQSSGKRITIIPSPLISSLRSAGLTSRKSAAFSR